MKKTLVIRNKIEKFKISSISVPGDKSLSIRFVILASLSNGRCKAKNILRSEDVMSAIKILKNLGIKININKKLCEVYGNGLNGYKFKKNLILDSGNSGTTARLMIAALIKSSSSSSLQGLNNPGNPNATYWKRTGASIW